MYVEQNLYFFGIVIFFSPDVYIFHSGGGSEFVFQNCHVMVTSLGCCCSYKEGAPQSVTFWSSCNVRGKMGEGEMEDDIDMIMEVKFVVCIQNLGGRLVLISIGA